jgi:hypothetical protein
MIAHKDRRAHVECLNTRSWEAFRFGSGVSEVLFVMK